MRKRKRHQNTLCQRLGIALNYAVDEMTKYKQIAATATATATHYEKLYNAATATANAALNNNAKLLDMVTKLIDKLTNN